MRSPFEGRLVRLRAREPEDVAVIHSWVADEETIHFNETRYPISVDSMRPRGTLQPSFEHSRFAILDRETGALVGDIALHTQGPENRGGFLGLLVGPDYRSLGFGTDAMRTICRFGFDSLNLHRIELDVIASNERACHVYRKVGFQIEGRRRACYFYAGEYEDFVMMGLLRHELIEED